MRRVVLLTVPMLLGCQQIFGLEAPQRNSAPDAPVSVQFVLDGTELYVINTS